MESNKIHELLEKYWNAESSVEDEAILRNFFKQKHLPDQWKETADMFRYFDQQRTVTLAHNDGEKFVTNAISKTGGKIRSLVFNTMRIAAGIAVLVVAVWFVRSEVNESEVVEIKDTYEDPRMAFEETKKALMIISKSFDAAGKEAKKINLFNEAQEQIKKDPKIELKEL